MADKVLHEMRFIETDDGFRIEIKGDKEQLRKMGIGPEMFSRRMFGGGRGRGRGEGKRHGRGERHGHHKHGKRGRRGPGMHRRWRGPFGHGMWDMHHSSENSEKSEPKDA